MKKNIAILMAFLVLLASTALAEAEPDNPAAGAWYADLDGVPVTLTLDADGGYTFALPAALGEPRTGEWMLDDGFVRLGDGSALSLVNESLLVWTENALFFSREPAQYYVAAELCPDAILELYAGYWKCAFVDLGDAIVPARALDETTDLCIENATVALGGPRFGDIFWTFDFTDGILCADVNGQAVTLALQQDGFMRLTLGDVNLYLAQVHSEVPGAGAE